MGLADGWMDTRTFPMEMVSGMAWLAQRFPTDKRSSMSRKDFFKRAFVIDAIADLPAILHGLAIKK